VRCGLRKSAAGEHTLRDEGLPIPQVGFANLAHMGALHYMPRSHHALLVVLKKILRDAGGADVARAEGYKAGMCC